MIFQHDLLLFSDWSGVGRAGGKKSSLTSPLRRGRLAQSQDPHPATEGHDQILGRSAFLKFNSSLHGMISLKAHAISFFKTPLTIPWHRALSSGVAMEMGHHIKEAIRHCLVHRCPAGR